jgi:hypothetical protein
LQSAIDEAEQKVNDFLADEIPDPDDVE